MNIGLADLVPEVLRAVRDFACESDGGEFMIVALFRDKIRAWCLVRGPDEDIYARRIIRELKTNNQIPHINKTLRYLAEVEGIIEYYETRDLGRPKGRKWGGGARCKNIVYRLA